MMLWCSSVVKVVEELYEEVGKELEASLSKLLMERFCCGMIVLWLWSVVV